MSVLASFAGVSVDVATLSRCGARERNEDACGYWNSEHGGCFVVSDGAGGHGGGDIASETTVKTILSAFCNRSVFDRGYIEGVVSQADAAVRYCQQLSAKNNMSATVAAAFLNADASQLQLIHLGDTRVYRFRRNQGECLTKDHSLVQALVDSGRLDASEARSHPKRHVLLSALGAREVPQPQALSEALPVQEGDAYLLCTDGFWDVITESAMACCLRLADSAQEWLFRMAEEVEHAGNPDQDNYTALAFWVGRPNPVSVPWPPRSSLVAAVS